jgi:hypothetical protein
VAPERVLLIAATSRFRAIGPRGIIVASPLEHTLEHVRHSLTKIEWRAKKPVDIPYDIKVPAAVYAVEFMVKDSKRFAHGGGWGYAAFTYDAASNTYAPATLTHQPPQGNDASAGPRATRS